MTCKTAKRAAGDRGEPAGSTQHASRLLVLALRCSPALLTRTVFLISTLLTIVAADLQAADAGIDRHGSPHGSDTKHVHNQTRGHRADWLMSRDDRHGDPHGGNLANEWGRTNYSKPQRCGTHRPVWQNGRDDMDARVFTGCAPPSSWEGTITVTIIWHVIYDPSISDATGGNITAADINANIEVLNRGFRGEDSTGESLPDIAVAVGLQFRLHDIKRIPNADWFRGCLEERIDTLIGIVTDTWQDIKRAHVIEPSLHMNVFSCGPTNGNLGRASFPFDYTSQGVDCSEGSSEHAVFVDYKTALPDQNVPWYPYRFGDTLVHEAGHYFGLYHTFSENPDCNNEIACLCTDTNMNGDEIGDTPAEAEAYMNDCPGGQSTPPDKDTCVSDPGLDPIQNFMDYSHDNCMNHFTQGQKERMKSMTTQYRPKLIEFGTPSDPPTPHPTTSSPTSLVCIDESACSLLNSDAEHECRCGEKYPESCDCFLCGTAPETPETPGTQPVCCSATCLDSLSVCLTACP